MRQRGSPGLSGGEADVLQSAAGVHVFRITASCSIPSTRPLPKCMLSFTK